MTKPCTTCGKEHYGEEDSCIECRIKEEERFKGIAEAMGDSFKYLKDQRDEFYNKKDDLCPRRRTTP